MKILSNRELLVMVNTPKSPHLPRQASSAAKGMKSSAAVVKGDQISLPSKKLLAICLTHARKNRIDKLSLLGREAVRSVMVQKEE